MRNILKTASTLLVAILFIASIAMPHICFAETNDTTHATTILKKTDTSHHDKPQKGDHLCMSGHCCVTKVVRPALFSIGTAMVTPAVLQTFTAATLVNQTLEGLERPPKHLA